MLTNKIAVAVVVLTIHLCAATTSRAQAAKLATAKGIKCTFSLMTLSAIREDTPKAEVKPSTLTLEFEDVNADEGSARLKSGFGDYDIVVRYAQGYLHFIQSFRDGPVYVTTVLEQKNSAGKFKAMHSRHEYTQVSLPGYTSSPEQYYGQCEIV